MLVSVDKIVFYRMYRELIQSVRLALLLSPAGLIFVKKEIIKNASQIKHGGE